jgi:hypothetical protein
MPFFSPVLTHSEVAENFSFVTGKFIAFELVMVSFSLHLSEVPAL